SAIQTFKGLSKATNYDQYRSSLNNFRTPPQNIVFASKEGEIALTIQGQFPMRHPEQGRFVLDGSTSESAWKGTIPIKHNPSIRNPESGFVSSANQRSTGPSYPYNYHGRFSDYRGRYLNRRLEEMEKITVEDMMKLQNDNFSIKAEEALPLLIKYLESPDGHSNGSALLTELKNWDYRFERDQEAPTYFQIWWRNFYKNTWDEIYALQKEKGAIAFPESYRTIAIMEEDPESVFFDIQATDKKENISDIVRQSFGEMAEEIAGRTAEGQSNLWGDYRPAPIGNLARIPAFGVLDKRISGDKSALNANSNGAGPSWRMIVELGEEPRAFGVYPGGQSGNPGSPYYDSMLDYWAEGKYYELKFWQAAPSDNDEEVLFEETYSK
ncbi:MAG: penicillin acylase family protein, partial [Bacteroidota bacterium]